MWMEALTPEADSTNNMLVWNNGWLVGKLVVIRNLIISAFSMRCGALLKTLRIRDACKNKSRWCRTVNLRWRDSQTESMGCITSQPYCYYAFHNGRLASSYAWTHSLFSAHVTLNTTSRWWRQNTLDCSKAWVPHQVSWTLIIWSWGFPLLWKSTLSENNTGFVAN